MDKEKLIKTLMEEAEKDGEPITREEAEEMADMEIKANGLKNYTQATIEKKPRKKREVKKDPTKVNLITHIFNWLLTTPLEDVTIVNEQREITFVLKNETYSLVLTKHRPKKEV
jgi:hypothetical protein